MSELKFKTIEKYCLKEMEKCLEAKAKAIGVSGEISKEYADDLDLIYTDAETTDKLKLEEHQMKQSQAKRKILAGINEKIKPETERVKEESLAWLKKNSYEAILKADIVVKQLWE